MGNRDTVVGAAAATALREVAIPDGELQVTGS
jgi:hypothetical protein